jgi:flagella basal body P-ring formation protein FlgA
MTHALLSKAGRIARMAGLALSLVGAGAATAAAAGSSAAVILPVPAATIYPGDHISADMLTEKQFYVQAGRPHAFVEDPAPVIGKVARRTLVAGKPIPNNAFAEPHLLTRGVATEALFKSGGLTISALVVPLQNGSLGAVVQARNVDSGQIISGIVQEDGTLLVGGVGTR